MPLLLTRHGLIHAIFVFSFRFFAVLSKHNAYGDGERGASETNEDVEFDKLIDSRTKYHELLCEY